MGRKVQRSARSSSESVPVDGLIHTVRGQRVIISHDLAAIYDVEPRVLNQAVNRNRERFPPDFAFRLSRQEAAELRRLRSQSVILKRGQHTKYPPMAFTEHGAIMAATVLNSPRAIHMSVFVVRAFLRVRQWVADQAELSARLVELERRVGVHDEELKGILHAIRQLIERPTESERWRIGFASVASPRRRPPT